MDKFSLELDETFLRRRRNNKWHLHPPDVLPAFVAEMDLAVAPCIQAAVERIVREQDYGYPKRSDERADREVANAFVRHMKRRFGWETVPELALPVADLVQGTYASLLAFSDPGDGVILQVPNYPPFREAIVSTERRLLSLHMRDTGARYAFDMAELKRLVDPGTRIFILCNPQNPTGRVFSRDELLAIGRFAVEHDLIIVSDEIHSDLVYTPRQHIPIASLGPEIAARSVTLNSATKSYNIPGLRCGVVHFGTEELAARYHKRIPLRLTGQCSVAGIDATVAAWDDGQPWLDAVMEHLRRARDRAVNTFSAELPAIKLYAPEATYLLWLDCSDLGLSLSAFEFFLGNARVGLSEGERFEPALTQFVRLNFATSFPILEQILERMVTAVRRNQR